MGLLFLAGCAAICSAWCILSCCVTELASTGTILGSLGLGKAQAFTIFFKNKLSSVLRFVKANPCIKRYVNHQSDAAKANQCEQEMAQLLDVLALGLEAGLSFDASLGLYCHTSDTQLSSVMQQAMSSWQIGLRSRSEALETLAQEINTPSFARFCHAVCEALSFGTPLAHMLEDQAALLRQEQRAGIQKRIEEAPVRMLVPLTTLVVPAMLLAILGPLLSGAL